MRFPRTRSQPSHVLRIGVVRDGRVILESLLKKGEQFSLGADVANTVIYEEPGFSERFTLLEWDGGSFVLNMHPEISGVLARAGEVSNLADQFLCSGYGRPDGRVALRLDPQTRGKIRLTGLTILFQLVADPAQGAHEPAASPFRPVLFEADDRPFMGSLTLFSMLGVLAGSYFWLTPVPVLDGPAEIPERVVRVMLAPPEPPAPHESPPEETLPEVAKPEPAKTSPQPKVVLPEGLAPTSPTLATDTSERRRNRALENSEFLRMLEESEGVASARELTSAQPSDSSLQAALLATHSLHAKVGTELGSFREGDAWADTRQQASIGLVDEREGNPGSATLGNAQLRAPRVSQARLKLDLPSESADVEVIKIVRQRSAAIKACYEAELTKNPNLVGRLVLDLSIQNGKVATAVVNESTLGSNEVARCAENRARTWRFPESVTDEVSIPYTFSAVD